MGSGSIPVEACCHAASSSSRCRSSHSSTIYYVAPIRSRRIKAFRHLAFHLAILDFDTNFILLVLGVEMRRVMVEKAYLDAYSKEFRYGRHKSNIIIVSICKSTHFISIGEIYFLAAASETAICETFAVVCATAVWGIVCTFAF